MCRPEPVWDPGRHGIRTIEVSMMFWRLVSSEERNIQELVAPRTVVFFSSESKYLGNKDTPRREIFCITGIAIEASDCSVSERMKWAEHITTRKEDEAYSSLGTFDFNTPLIYGEGEGALTRLREYIDRSIRGTRQHPLQDFHIRMIRIRANLVKVLSNACRP